MPGWRGLTLRLIALAIIPLAILLLIVLFGSFNLHQHAMRHLVGERDERAARAAAAALDEQLRYRAAAIQGLALHAASAPEPARLLAEYAFLRPDFDGGLAFYDADGRLLADQTTAEGFVWPASRPATESDGFFSQTITDAAGQTLTLVAATAPDGSAAVGAFSPANLARRTLLTALADDETIGVFLLDSRGHLLYQTGPLSQPPDALPQHPGAVSALRGESGAIHIANGSQEYIVAFSPVPATGWALVMEDPWEAVADPLLQTTLLAPLLLAPIVLLALLAVWYGAQQIVRPLHLLAQKATDLGWGRFEAIEEPVGGIAEIQRLQTELIHMARKVKAAQQSLRSYVGAITAGQEEERRRLARELHDDTIQALIALNQRVQLAQLALGDQPAAAKLAEIERMAAQAIEDVRRFTRDLRPIYLEELGLVPALDALCRDTGKALSIPVDCNIVGPARRLRPEIELALYRMAQEALNNAGRHAAAGRITVGLDFSSEVVILTVEDDGRGFTVPESPAEMAPLGHFGLLGLHERAELIGARLKIDSRPGGGTLVRIEVSRDVSSSNL